MRILRVSTCLMLLLLTSLEATDYSYYDLDGGLITVTPCDSVVAVKFAEAAALRDAAAFAEQYPALRDDLSPPETIGAGSHFLPTYLKSSPSVPPIGSTL